MFDARCEEISSFLKEFSVQLQNYESYCKLNQLIADPNTLSLLRELERMANEMLVKVSDAEASSKKSAEERQDETFGRYHAYRCLLVLKMALGSMLDWRSASYNQSRHTNFFYGSSVGSQGVNYNRYESHLLTELEANMKKVLDFDDTVEVLMTSSGMAAYNLFESFALRHILEPGDVIYVPHYIYFETAEQLSGLKQYNVVKTDTTNAMEIAENIKRLKPKLVFLDAMNNNRELRITDVERVLKELDAYDETIHVFIDGTMLSGVIQPFRACTNSKVKIFHLESCSKYLQMGQDLAMAGLLAFPKEFAEAMSRQRRNTGTILYDTSVLTFPRFSREAHLQRMRVLTRNGLAVANAVNGHQGASQFVRANFPLLPEHPDYELAKHLESVGGIVTFTFLHPAMKDRTRLNQLIASIVTMAKVRNLSIVHGVSFGFSVPRLSACAAMDAGDHPFLRLSVGDVEAAYAQKIGEVIAEAIEMEF